MPFNGAGLYSPPAADFPAVANTLIESTHFNNVINDIATGLSNCITKDGQQTVTANIPMNTFVFTGLGSGIASRTRSANIGDVQDGAAQWGGTAGGTANALTFTLSPAITAYSTGMRLYGKSGAAANTTAATVQVNGIAGPLALQLNGAALVAGDIEASQWYEFLYDGAAVQIKKMGIPALIHAIVFDSSFALSGVLAPAQITANQNDYNPTGLSTAAVLRLNTDASRNITGIVGGAVGRLLLLQNVGAQNIVLKNQDAGSTAGNRFLLGGDTTLAADQTITLAYDNTTARWRPFSGIPAFGTQTANLVFAGPSSGGAATPTFRTLAGTDGASKVLLGSATAAASASLTFTSLLSSTYDIYELEFVNLVPATDAQNLLLRLSIDNGATYKAGAADYQYYVNGINNAGAAVTPVSGGATAILIASGTSNVATDGGVNGIVRIYAVNNTNARKWTTSHLTCYTTAAGGQVMPGGGNTVLAALSTSAVNALQLLMGAGNLTSGAVYLYGIRKA